ERRGITKQLLLSEEGGVPPVVRDQAREGEAEFRIFVARIRKMAGGEGDVRIFPGAPLPRRVVAHGGIDVEQQRGVGIGQRQVPEIGGGRGWGTRPPPGGGGAPGGGGPLWLAAGGGRARRRPHPGGTPPTGGGRGRERESR